MWLIWQLTEWRGSDTRGTISSCLACGVSSRILFRLFQTSPSDSSDSKGINLLLNVILIIDRKALSTSPVETVRGSHSVENVQRWEINSIYHWIIIRKSSHFTKRVENVSSCDQNLQMTIHWYTCSPESSYVSYICPERESYTSPFPSSFVIKRMQWFKRGEEPREGDHRTIEEPSESCRLWHLGWCLIFTTWYWYRGDRSTL